MPGQDRAYAGPVERSWSPGLAAPADGRPPAAPALGLVPAVVLTLALALGGCSGPGRPGPATTTSAAPAPAPAPVSFTIGTLDVQAVRAEARLPDDVRAGLKATLDLYLDRAVLGPLRSGRGAGDLSAVFTLEALEHLAGPDREVLVDEGLGPATGAEARAATADLTVLMGADGAAAVVASVHLRVVGTTVGAPLSVERAGELLLVDGEGGWKVGGYDVTATREVGGAVTTTTARR